MATLPTTSSLRTNKEEDAKKNKKTRKKRVKRHHVEIRPIESPKVMIVTGDTILVKDFIMNEIRPQFELSIQQVPATIKRNANTFKL